MALSYYINNGPEPWFERPYIICRPMFMKCTN